MRRAFLLTFLMWPLLLLSQGPVLLQGTVVDSETNMPLSKAIVELLGSSSPGTITDANGRFFFPNMRPGGYRLSATRDGYVRAEYGQRKWGGPTTPLVINGSAPAGSAPADVRIAMTRGGVISGRITDRGRPAGGAEVIALKVSYSEGQRVASYVLTARTNDLGEYHLLWLPPGQYMVGAVVADSLPDKPSEVLINANADLAASTGTVFVERRTWRAGLVGRNVATDINDNEMHVPMLFPGVPDSQSASFVEIRAGANVRGIDIAVNPVTPRRIKGIVTGIQRTANGQTVGVSIRAALLNTSTASAYTAQTDANGAFEILGVRPASYMVTATSGTLSASQPVDLRGGRDADVVLSLIPGLELTGRVTVETTQPIPNFPNLTVSLRLDPFVPGSAVYSATTNADGTFTLPVIPVRPPNAPPAEAVAIPTGNYRVFVNAILQPSLLPGATRPPAPTALQNAYVKSIRLGDMDVLNGGLQLRSQPRDILEVVIGNNPGSLEGRVVNASKEAVSAVWVAMIPENGLKFRIDHKYAATNAEGLFQIQGVPPGDYTVYAWEAAERGDWQQPEFMRRFEGRGVNVRIGEGAKTMVEILSIPSN